VAAARRGRRSGSDSHPRTEPAGELHDDSART
jgi:hypothetical protein